MFLISSLIANKGRSKTKSVANGICSLLKAIYKKLKNQVWLQNDNGKIKR